MPGNQFFAQIANIIRLDFLWKDTAVRAGFKQPWMKMTLPEECIRAKGDSGRGSSAKAVSVRVLR